MNSKRAFAWIVLIAATLVATFLRFYQLGAQSLWDGEIFTLLFARFDWSILLQSVSSFSAHPPLWFALSKLAITGGWNEWILRLPAAFAGILSVPALYILGKRLFDWRVGLMAAVLIAVSPLDVIFSQNARNYSFFVLLTILLLYAAYRATHPSTLAQLPSPNGRGVGGEGATGSEGAAGGEGNSDTTNTSNSNGNHNQSASPTQRSTLNALPSPQSSALSPHPSTPSGVGSTTRRSTLHAPRSTAPFWLLFILTALAGLYTHYLFVLPLAGTVLAIALTLIFNAVRQVGSWRAVGAWWRIALRSARWFLIALIAIVALYLPWTPSVGSAFLDRQLTREAANEEAETALTIQDAPRLLKDFSGQATWGLVLFGALAAIGIVWAAIEYEYREDGSRRYPKRAALFWFGTAILLPILAMVLLAPRRLPAKYLIYVLPAYLLLVANGIDGITELARLTVLKTERRAYALGGVILLLLVIAVIPNMPYWNGTQTIFTGTGWAVVDDWKPWRDAAASVVTQAAPGDAILFPNEARALTARSVVPYFDDAFLQKIYSAPPSGRVWWVSEAADVPASNAAHVVSQQNFGDVVVQQLDHSGALTQAPPPNANFDDGLNNWEKSNDAISWSVEPAAGFDGQSALRVTALHRAYTTVRSNEIPVTPGKLYRVTAYVHDPTFGFYTVTPQLFVNFYEPNDKSPKRTRLATVVPTDKPGWYLTISEGIVPDDAQTARLEFGIRDYALDFQPTSLIDNVQVWLEK